jgi:hypothetical protein
MHLREFFQSLLPAPDVQVVPAPLPDTVMRVVLHCWGQLQALLHLPAPRQAWVPAQMAQNEMGRTFRQLLHGLGRIREIAGPDHKVAVLGHQHVANDLEAQLAAPLVERLIIIVNLSLKRSESKMRARR